MKILLVAINAKYIHSNLAVYSLKTYASQHGEEVELCEYTINHRREDILKGIYKKKPDVVAFSTYIWNVHMVDGVAEELKKVLPEVIIWAGGPEVSYNPEEQLQRKPWLTGVMIGEGEATFYELCCHYQKKTMELSDIAGLCLREGRTKVRQPLDLSTIPFPYPDLGRFENKIIYYESSRGCPFSCSYCLSSIERGLRFRDLALVKEELSQFINSKIPLVKFIDRTFNASHSHAMAIWQFIYESDQGTTSFHFEISADLLKEEEIALIKKFRPGLIQFEIGVQTINEKTIEAIRRKMDLNKLKASVKAVSDAKNIHQHLDLIAGLPFEDIHSFQDSFDAVYQMKPEQLQLGFLKVLKGSYLYEKREDYNILFTNASPFEVLSTRWLSYEDVLELKKVEEMVEVYYNSGQFVSAISYLLHFFKRPYAFFKALGDFYEEKGYLEISHNRLARYQILREFRSEIVQDDGDFFDEILLYDLYLRENLKSRPAFAKDESETKDERARFYQEEELLRQYLPDYDAYQNKQIRRMTHLEIFSFDMISTVASGRYVAGRTRILFDYKNRNPFTQDAHVLEV
ncbi:MAG: hypothetical protein PWP24_957 [Clostridiales bacterium]|nr:hypothetical protein [Clostridiales bacterium]